MTKKTRWGAAVVGALLLGTTLSIQAKSPFQKAVSIVVPFNAGTGSDADARFYGNLLSERIGQPVIVENRAGASGLIAVQAVMSAPADGHTILLASNSPMAVNPAVMKNLSYDPFTDFRPLVGLTLGAAAFAVSGSSPMQSMSEVVQKAKKENRPLSVGNYSLGYQLVAAFLGTEAGVEANHINYKGGAQIVSDVIGGRLDVGIVAPTAFLEMHKDGRLRMLGVTSAERMPMLPDVPTMIESGFPDFETYVWASLFVRSETPEEITDTLIKELDAVVHSPEAEEYRTRLGATLLDLQGDKLRDFQRREYERFKKIAETAGLMQ